MTSDKGDKHNHDEETQYKKFAEKASHLFDKLKDKTATSLDDLLEKTKKEMVHAGEIGAEQGEKFKEYLKKDLSATKEDLGKLGEQLKEKAHPSRLSAGFLQIVYKVAGQLSDGFSHLAKTTSESLTYHTGGVCGPGTLTCTKCGKSMIKTKESRIPPCSGCKGTEFTKSY